MIGSQLRRAGAPARRVSAVAALAFLAVGGGGALVAGVLGGQGASASPTCTLYWTGRTSTAWATQGNWSLTDGGPSAARVPASTDFLCMSSAPSTSTVVASTTNKTISGLNFAAVGGVVPNLEIQGGIFTVNTNASTINNLQVDSGTLAGTAGVALTGAASVPSGAVFDGGTKTVASGATLSALGGLTIGSAASPAVSGSLVNNGTVSLGVGAQIAVATGTNTLTPSSLTNPGALTLADTSSIVGYGSGTQAPSFASSGSIATTAISSSGPAAITLPFTNSGTVTTSNTPLSITSGNVASTSDVGTWVTGNGAVVFSGASRSLAGGSVTGTAGVQVIGGSVNFASGVTLSSLDVEAGTVTGSPSVTNAIINGGTLTGSGTMTLVAGGTSTIGAGCPTIDSGYRVLNHGSLGYNSTCYVFLSNGGVLENAGSFTITGGASGYAVYSDGNPANALLNDAGATTSVNLAAAANNVIVTSAFNNNGTVTTTMGTLTLAAGNLSGSDTGTYNLAGGTAVILSGGTRNVSAGTVSGAGSLQVNGGSVNFASGVTLSSLDVEAGTVTGSPSVTNATLYSGTLTGSGTMTLVAGGTSTIGAGCPTIDSGYRVLNNGSLGYDSTCYLSLSNGGVLENAGSFTITGGASGYAVNTDGNPANALLNDAGATTSVNLAAAANNVTVLPPVTNNGTITATKGSLTLLALTNLSGTGVLSGGAYNVAGGNIVLPGNVITNGSNLNIGVAGSLSNGTTSALPTLASNTGSLSLAQPLTTAGPLSNSGSVSLTAGTLRANAYTQTGGTTFIGTGAALKAGSSGTAAIAINAGQLTGTGAVQGALSGAGSVAPGSPTGTLGVAGSYTPAAAATLSVTMSPSASSQLQVSGPSTLNGTLAITTAPGPAPAIGSIYTIISSTSLSGTFATVTGQDVISPSEYYDVAYTSTAVTLTVKPLPSLSIGAVSVNQTPSSSVIAAFPITLSAASGRQVAVQYATFDGTALAGHDYTATSGTVVVPAGATTATVNVSILPESLYDLNETLTVVLSAPIAATIGQATATGSVVNPAPMPSGSIGNTTANQGSSGTSVLSFPVTLSAASDQVTTVDFATADGTAKAGIDYQAASGTLTIPAGTPSGTISISVLPKSIYQANENMTVTLSNPVGGTLGTAGGTGTIVNTNPSGPTVTAITPATIGQGAKNHKVTISGTGFASGPTLSVPGGGITASSVVLVSPTQITAQLTAGATSAIGVRNVTVTVAGATGSCTGCLTVVTSPNIATLSPSTLATGATKKTVTVTGSGFEAGVIVKVSPSTTITAKVTAVTATSLTLSVTIPQNVAPGLSTLTTTNPDGGTSKCANCFTVTQGPTLSGISPPTASRGSTVPVTLTGTGFVTGATVKGPSGVSFTSVVVVNATTITATMKVSSTATPGVNLTVSVNDPSSAGWGIGSSACLTIT